MAMQRVDIRRFVFRAQGFSSRNDSFPVRNVAVKKTGGQHFVIEMRTGLGFPAGYNSASMDIYVLEGSFSLGDDMLTVGCYTYIPGGMACGDWHSENGARVLFSK